MLVLAQSLPSSPAGLTADWMQSALRAGTGDTHLEVTSVEVGEVIWGTATKAFVEVVYAEPRDDLPTSFCVKGGLDPRLDAVGSRIALIMEARFYGSLCDNLGISTLRSYYAGVTEDQSQGVVVLEDLRSAGATFHEPGAALDRDAVASGLDFLARLHGSSWGLQPDAGAGIRTGSVVRRAVKLFLSDTYWTSTFGGPELEGMPRGLRTREELADSFAALWRIEDSAPALSLLHGDAHVGNTVQTAGVGLTFMDWQTYCLGPWSYDVSYFISGALSVDDRREHERDLLRHYLDRLRTAGGPAIDDEVAWSAYRLHLPHGLIWSLVPDVMQAPERSLAMRDRHVAAVEDHRLLDPTPSFRTFSNPWR
jgi:hypothetical protein